MEDGLENTLDQRQIRPTAMRLLVLKVLTESSHALSLIDIEAKFERADRATLFRTLKTFEQQKLVHAIADGSGSTKYALCSIECTCSPSEQHVHFHCEKCEETFCLTQTKIPNTQIPVGFRVNTANMVYRGLCANCT